MHVKNCVLNQEPRVYVRSDARRRGALFVQVTAGHSREARVSYFKCTPDKKVLKNPKSLKYDNHMINSVLFFYSCDLLFTKPLPNEPPPEKLIVAQLAKRFPAVYGNRKFIGKSPPMVPVLSQLNPIYPLVSCHFNIGMSSTSRSSEWSLSLRSSN